MGHQVSYCYGLKFLEPLTKEQEDFIFDCIENHKTGINYQKYDRLHDMKLNEDKTMLVVNKDADKVYYKDLYGDIIKFIPEFKKLGNDFEENSKLLSCSEYGINDGETKLLLYKNGNFIIYDIDDVINNFIDNIKADLQKNTNFQ